MKPLPRGAWVTYMGKPVYATYRDGGRVLLRHFAMGNVIATRDDEVLVEFEMTSGWARRWVPRNTLQ